MLINKLSEHIGAEVMGIDLSRPVDDAIRRRLYNALVDNVAIVIRDQKFTARQFLDAASLFGEVMEDQDKRFKMPELPLVRILSSQHKDKNGDRLKVGESWHSDHTNQLYPPKFTTLYALELPDTGGNTNLANMRLGFESLPEAVRQRIDGMQTVSVYVGSAARQKSIDRLDAQAVEKPPEATHPLIRTNPDNGTKAIYFHPSKVENIVGMDPESSQELIHDLTAQAIRPEFIYSHKWRVGDMLIWDNRSAFHRADQDYDTRQHRLMYRIMIKGERPH